MTDMFSLEGFNCIVTGGGRGLGTGMAEGFLKNGANLIITGSSDAIYKKAEEWKAMGYEKVHPVHMDLRDRKQRAEAFDECVDYFGGKLDVLLNNAGVQNRLPLLDYPIDVWDDIIEVDITAVFDLSQRAARVMVPRKYGKIINVASLGSFISCNHNIPAYMAAKGAVKQLTICFADELAPYNICTNAIAPGYYKTELGKVGPVDPEVAAAKAAETAARIPMQRWGQYSDLAGAAVLLASHAGDYINGITIPVDGGVLTR